MKTKLTGYELLAESVTLLLNFSPKETASLCGYKSKKSWLLAIEKIKKQIKKKKKKTPIALLCPASDEMNNAIAEGDSAQISDDDLMTGEVTIF